MGVLVLTIESEFESAKNLGYPTKTDVYQIDVETKDTVIRWGNSERFGRDFKTVVNPAKSIRANCHKLNALVAMSKVVDTPKSYTTEAKGKGKVLIRPIAHTGGVDFSVVSAPVKIDPEHYGTEWIETKTEYRVWFAWGKTICGKRVRVIKTDDGWEDDDTPEAEFPCRSSWGYSHFRYTPGKLHTDVLKAAEVLGLTTGAANVLVKDDRFIFLELNSAPSVDTPKITKFFKDAILENVPAAKELAESKS